MKEIILAGAGGCMRELVWQIQELNKKYENDLKESLDRAKELKKLGDKYNNFSGKQDTMDGSVKFIIKTDEIKAAK